MIEVKKGNLVNASEQIIAHQVNCKGVMGSGVARSIRNYFPEAYEEYRKFCEESLYDASDLLGCNQYVAIPKKKKVIVNLFAQNEYGKNGRYTDYEALKLCFLSLAKNVKVPLAMPYKIGCGRGGGNWDNIVYPMIQEIFKDNDLTLYIL